MRKMYEKGKIKVVWVEENHDIIYSKMFDIEAEAIKYSKEKKDYLIFGLEDQHNMEEFRWRLLPYGRYKSYKFFVNLGRQQHIKIPHILSS